MASQLVETTASPEGRAATNGTSTPTTTTPAIDISKTLSGLSDKWKNTACVFCGSSDGNKPIYKVKTT